MRWLVWLYPLAELWSLIALGAYTAAGAALLWVLGAGFAGVVAVRLAGMQVLRRLHRAKQEGVLHQNLVAGDMALAAAGLLLMVPGLISDALAVLVLIPQLRGTLVRLVGFCLAAKSRSFNHSHTHQSTRDQDSSRRAPSKGAQRGVTLEGEFQELDAEPELLQRPNAQQSSPSQD